MKNIVIIGGGNQAHYVIDIIERTGKYNIVGITDSIHPVGTDRFGYKIIGRQEDILELIDQHQIYGGIIAVGDNWIRENIYLQVSSLAPNFEFINAIHPSVIIGNNVKIGKGVTAMANVIFNPKSIIGDFTFFATGAQIEHDCIISDFASISAGSITGGHVKLGKYSALTLGVTVLDRLEIGENTVVGAGSLVLKSLPSNILAYGNPAKIIRNRIIGEKFLK
jgi:sugar O-acyltransferase (sialic acid O-acetyltransferase NeuD family)